MYEVFQPQGPNVPFARREHPLFSAARGSRSHTRVAAGRQRWPSRRITESRPFLRVQVSSYAVDRQLVQTKVADLGACRSNGNPGSLKEYEVGVHLDPDAEVYANLTLHAERQELRLAPALNHSFRELHVCCRETALPS